MTINRKHKTNIGVVNVVAQTYFIVGLPCAELADKRNVVM